MSWRVANELITAPWTAAGASYVAAVLAVLAAITLVLIVAFVAVLKVRGKRLTETAKV